MSSTPAQARTWRPGRPCPVPAILGRHRRGARRPDVPHRRPRRALARPPHPRGARDARGSRRGRARARCTPRPGARARRGRWTSVPDLLGADDDLSGFEPRHPVLVEAWRRHGDWRLGRSGLVMESLVPAILEQKVTGQEAFAGFRMLVHRYGERAPGPGAASCGCGCSRTPETLRTIPSWEWLRMHVDPARSRAVVTRRPGGRVARAHRGRAARGGRPAAAEPAGHRGVDQRRGPRPRAHGRPRRGVVRRLPRGQGHRVGADRARPSTTPSWRRSSSPGGGTGAGCRRWSGSPACTGRGAARGCRRAPTCRPGHPRSPATGQSSGRRGASTNSVNLRCRSRASHSLLVSSRLLDSSTAKISSSAFASASSITSTLIS